jgi:hypothetical protein
VRVQHLRATAHRRVDLCELDCQIGVEWLREIRAEDLHWDLLFWNAF